MKVDELKKILEELPDDLQVVVPTGMNWRPVTEVKTATVTEDERGNLTPTASPRKGLPMAVLLCPYKIAEED